MNPADKKHEDSLPLAGSSPPPVFNCVVYVAGADAGVVARNAHWTDLEFHGASEREAIQKLVAAFKTRAAEHHAAGKPLPFDEPPPPPAEHESRRFVPVHL